MRYTKRLLCASLVLGGPALTVAQTITDSLSAAGRTIDQVRAGATVVALRRDGSIEPQPPPDTVLRDGDVLVAIGETAALEKLETQLAPA